MAITGEIKGRKLIVTIDLQDPEPSTSGKTLLVATTAGNRALDGCEVNGKQVMIGVNAYIKP